MNGNKTFWLLQVDLGKKKKERKKEKKTYILNIASTLTTGELISTSSVNKAWNK